MKAHQWILILLSALLTFASCASRSNLSSESVRELAPSQSSRSFDYYTFAVVWHPGACQSREFESSACVTEKPQSDIFHQWTLHGLWPSMPADLKNKIDLQTWWKDGCFLYDRRSPPAFCENQAVVLESATDQLLRPQMPGMEVCLERHEYFKHAACFGFEPNSYFKLSVKLLNHLNKSSFTDYLRAHRGQHVMKKALRDAFAGSFGEQTSKSLELRCSVKPGFADVLVEAWIAIKRDQVTQFPRADSFMDWTDGNCPERIWIAK